MNFIRYNILLLIISLSSCVSQKIKPYACGPIMKQKHIENSFNPLIEILELSKGDVFADIGASSGAYDVMISTLVKDVTFYIQDIDSSCLNRTELDKIINYYSNQSHQELASKNKFIIIQGSIDKTNLPNNTFDIIYTNGTFHVFVHKEEILNDIYQKLKKGGYLFIRESLAEEGKIEYCPDKECGHQLFYDKDLLKLVKESGLTFIKKYDDFNGYPIFKFQKK